LKKRQKAEEKERLKQEKAKKIAEKEAAEKAAKQQAEEVRFPSPSWSEGAELTMCTQTGLLAEQLRQAAAQQLVRANRCVQLSSFNYPSAR
jgi:hypothetical protein